MDALNIDNTPDVEEKIEHESLDAALNYRIYNTYLSDNQVKQNTVVIEEISEPFPAPKPKEVENYKIKITKSAKKSDRVEKLEKIEKEKSIVESKKEPLLKKTDTTPIKKEKSDLSTSKSLKKEKTDLATSKSVKQDLVTNESLKKEKTDLSKSKSIKQERPLSSSLTKTAEQALKEISTRKENFRNIITGGYNGIGEFLMLDVAANGEQSNKNENELAKTSEFNLEKENSSLSNLKLLIEDFFLNWF